MVMNNAFTTAQTTSPATVIVPKDLTTPLEDTTVVAADGRTLVDVVPRDTM
jgi:hypothetical protein